MKKQSDILTLAELLSEHRKAILKDCSVSEIMGELERRGLVSHTLHFSGGETTISGDLIIVDISERKEVRK